MVDPHQLQMDGKKCDLALFNFAIDSKLRGCDVVRLKVEDIAPRGLTADRARVRQRKTGHPVKFELTEQTRDAVSRPNRSTSATTCLRPRSARSLYINAASGIGLDPGLFGTHSLRRTKATLIYRRTGNLRAVQLLLGHTKIESTVRYLGIKVDDALTIAEQVDI
jgi:integrase